MKKVEIDDQIIKYNIIHSNRKTIGIQIDPVEGVLIRAPKRISNKKIEDIVVKKSNWILAKIEELSKILPPPAALEFVTGEKILYLGEYYELRINKQKDHLDKAKAIINFDGKFFNISINRNINLKMRKEIIKSSLIKWYKEQATLIINEQVNIFKQYIKRKPMNIKIKNQKTIWGSCSSKGNLNFNWKLIMAPIPVLEYIVIHELAHLVYQNHSSQYWKLVKKIIPDYKEREEWLRLHGLTLDIK